MLCSHQCHRILTTRQDGGGFRAVLITTMACMNASTAASYVRANTHSSRRLLLLDRCFYDPVGTFTVC